MVVRESNLKWISFTLQLDHHRCIHTAQREGDTLWNPPNLISVKFRQSGQTKKEENLICRARVPNILARSYFVIYLEVLRGRSTGSCSSLSSPSISTGASSLALFSKSSSAPSCPSFIQYVSQFVLKNINSVHHMLSGSKSMSTSISGSGGSSSYLQQKIS